MPASRLSIELARSKQSEGALGNLSSILADMGNRISRADMLKSQKRALIEAGVDPAFVAGMSPDKAAEAYKDIQVAMIQHRGSAGAGYDPERVHILGTQLNQLIEKRKELGGGQFQPTPQNARTFQETDAEISKTMKALQDEMDRGTATRASMLTSSGPRPAPSSAPEPMGWKELLAAGLGVEPRGSGTPPMPPVSPSVGAGEGSRQPMLPMPPSRENDLSYPSGSASRGVAGGSGFGTQVGGLNAEDLRSLPPPPSEDPTKTNYLFDVPPPGGPGSRVLPMPPTPGTFMGDNRRSPFTPTGARKGARQYGMGRRGPSPSRTTSDVDSAFRTAPQP